MNTKRKYQHMSNMNNDVLNTKIEAIFYEVQRAIDTVDLTNLSKLFTVSFFKKYKKSSKKLFLNNDKIHIENIEVKDITNFKYNNKSIAVDISFTAITYTNHDKNTVHWRIRHLATLFSANKEIGKSSVYKQSFKQRWFFVYEAQSLKVQKIKGIYLKQD